MLWFGYVDSREQELLSRVNKIRTTGLVELLAASILEELLQLGKYYIKLDLLGYN